MLKVLQYDEYLKSRFAKTVVYREKVASYLTSAHSIFSVFLDATKKLFLSIICKAHFLCRYLKVYFLKKIAHRCYIVKDRAACIQQKETPNTFNYLPLKLFV